MQHNDLVSIIIPVYGVEQYLADCIDSILAQTYSNLEVILIDDASPDGCGVICDAYAERDCRVKVIHKANGGAASARNVGLETATGAYICFVDSDDLLCPEYVNHLLDALTSSGADIAVCSFTQFSRHHEVLCGDMEAPGIFDKNQYLSFFLTNWTCALLWNKIYRRDTIGAIRMVEGHRIDDEFFTYKVIINAEKITVTNKTLYRYRQRASSVMGNVGSNGKRILLDRIQYTKERYAYICERVPELKNQFFLNAIDSYARYWKICSGNPEAIREIRNWVKSHFSQIIRAEIPLRMKLGLLYNLCFKEPGTEQPSDLAAKQSLEYFD